MTRVTPLHWRDGRALKAAYAAGEISPAAVTDHLLARITRLDGRLKSFIEIDTHGARAAAETSAARYAAGVPRVLEGLPIAVKANIAVAGLEWNAGMELRRGLVAQQDATVVARLRAAGAVVLGTLNMHEAALGATTDNAWFGRAENPHGQGRTPGGSSGGSGAAVAAGLCAVALGTDTLGSVRIPAAYNGVYGLKPTHGRVSDEGLAPLSLWLDSIGPLARSLDDLADAFAVIAEAAPAPASGVSRVLVLDDLSDLEPEPAVVAAYQAARGLLAGTPQVTWRPPQDAAAVRRAGFLVSARELGEHLGEARWSGEARLSQELRFMLGYVEGRSQAEADAAMATLQDTRASLRAAIGEDGVLLTPTAPQAAFAHTSRPPPSQSGFTAFANIAGLPALSLPAGRDDQGMPLAVQLIGPPNSEAALLALARTLDAGLAGYAPPLID